MSVYRLFRLDHRQRIQAPAVAHELSSDAEALVMARATLEGFPETSAVEVWDGSRWVQKVTRKTP